MDGDEGPAFEPVLRGKSDPRQPGDQQLQSQHKDMRQKIRRHHACVKGRKHQQQNRCSKPIHTQ
jgi:hypothetical protein